MSLQMTLTEMNCQGMIVAQQWSEKRTIKESKSQERRQTLFFKMLPKQLKETRVNCSLTDFLQDLTELFNFSS